MTQNITTPLPWHHFITFGSKASLRGKAEVIWISTWGRETRRKGGFSRILISLLKAFAHNWHQSVNKYVFFRGTLIAGAAANRTKWERAADSSWQTLTTMSVRLCESACVHACPVCSVSLMSDRCTSSVLCCCWSLHSRHKILSTNAPTFHSNKPCTHHCDSWPGQEIQVGWLQIA